MYVNSHGKVLEEREVAIKQKNSFHNVVGLKNIIFHWLLKKQSTEGGPIIYMPYIDQMRRKLQLFSYLILSSSENRQQRQEEVDDI